MSKRAVAATLPSSPTHGVRYDLERVTHTAPFEYRGQILSAGAEACTVLASIGASGEVAVHLPTEAEQNGRVRLFLRAVWKESEGAPPLFVRRWRDKK
jgi:hypothetical protein